MRGTRWRGWRRRSTWCAPDPALRFGLPVRLAETAEASKLFSQDEAALESLVLERGLPSVEFIWYAVSVVPRQTFIWVQHAFSHHYRSQARAVATVKPVQG